jgi:hypothetical protein
LLVERTTERYHALDGEDVERHLRARCSMKTRDKLLSVVRGAKDRTPTIVLGVVLLAGLFQGMRDIGKAPGVRRQLVGTWELTATVTNGVERPVPKLRIGSVRMTLNEDGSAIFGRGDEKGTWLMGDARHLHVIYEIPPDESVPDLAEGASEDECLEILSFSPNRFVERHFDVDADCVWSRVAEKPETSK